MSTPTQTQLQTDKQRDIGCERENHFCKPHVAAAAAAAAPAATSSTTTTTMCSPFSVVQNISSGRIIRKSSDVSHLLQPTDASIIQKQENAQKEIVSFTRKCGRVWN